MMLKKMINPKAGAPTIAGTISIDNAATAVVGRRIVNTSATTVQGEMSIFKTS